MTRSQKILVPVVLVAAVVVLVLVLVLTGGGESVEASASDGIPALTDDTRDDANGADTVEAYLQAALPCDSSGDAVRRALSGGYDPIADARTAGCAGGAERWADEAGAELTDEPSDSRGRTVWELSGLDGLPDGYRLAVRSYYPGAGASTSRATGRAGSSATDPAGPWPYRGRAA